MTSARSAQQALIEAARRGDRQALSDLVAIHYERVLCEARRAARGNDAVADDLLSAGLQALMDVARGTTFNASKGAFWTYAQVHVRGAMARQLHEASVIKAPIRRRRHVLETRRRLDQEMQRLATPAEVAKAAGLTTAEVEAILRAGDVRQLDSSRGDEEIAAAIAREEEEAAETGSAGRPDADAPDAGEVRSSASEDPERPRFSETAMVQEAEADDRASGLDATAMYDRWQAALPSTPLRKLIDRRYGWIIRGESPYTLEHAAREAGYKHVEDARAAEMHALDILDAMRSKALVMGE
ncbi:MAG: sigma-70 family RNA polymerase sigma factor [Gemmatimonadaceae bacterium]